MLLHLFVLLLHLLHLGVVQFRVVFTARVEFSAGFTGNLLCLESCVLIRFQLRRALQVGNSIQVVL